MPITTPPQHGHPKLADPPTPVGREEAVRVCRKCSTQAQTNGEFCPHCGARYSRKKRSKKTRRLLFAIPTVMVIAAAVVAAVLIVQHNHQVTVRHHAAHVAAVAAAHRRAAQHAAAEEQLAITRSAAKLKQDEARIERASLISALQGAVKKDAEKDVSDGTLTGTILKVQCQPGTAADATASIANYTCLAATSESGGELNGYRFTANINTQTGSYTWRLGG